MKFKTSEKVMVKTYDKMPNNWNYDMMQFMGKIVTISSIRGSRLSWPYVIEEDIRWVWQEKNFISLLADRKDPNYIFKYGRKECLKNSKKMM